MSNNSVTLFSNGLADFSCFYSLKAKKVKNLNITVSKKYIADVLGTLNVLGDGVSLVDAPSFKSSSTSLLALQPGKVIEGLAKSLAGSFVEVSGSGGSKFNGKLIGINTDKSENSKNILAIEEPTGIKLIDLNEVKAIHFRDEKIRKIIDATLRESIQNVQPDSNNIEFSVVSEKDGEAIVQYVVPNAAWKMTYRLTCGDNLGIVFEDNKQVSENIKPVADKLQSRLNEINKINFMAFAVVDNNTEENWDNINLSVVTGDPTTFETDLAEMKMPHREQVNVVDEDVRGIPSVAGTFGAGAVCASAPAAKVFGLARQNYSAASIEVVKEIKEVGDFSVFTAPALVSIPSKSSAVVPIMQKNISGNRVLHYDYSNSKDRPYASIYFKNTTGHALVRGPCAVYYNNVFSGQCMVPDIQKGEDCLLPHALENGVKIKRTLTPIKENDLLSIKLSDGWSHTFYESKVLTNYQINNLKDEEFSLFVDHAINTNPGYESTIQVKFGGKDLVGEKTDIGYRFKINIKSFQQCVLEVIESVVQQFKSKLADDFENLSSTAFKDNCPTALQPLFDLDKELVEIRAKRAAYEEEVRSLDENLDRWRKNLERGISGELSDKWLKQIDVATDKISEIQDDILPKFNEKYESLEREFEEAASKINLNKDFK